MKKIIYFTTISTILLITSCVKQNYQNANAQLASPESSLSISKEEFQNILSEMKSQEKTPHWWVKFVNFVKVHTGNSQVYLNGQPLCDWAFHCGPCPGICLGSVAPDLSADSTDEILNEMSRIKLTVIEKNDSTNNTKMIIEMPNSINYQVVRENYFDVSISEELPSYLALEAGYNSIIVLAGNYPIIYDTTNEVLRTIVNISVVQ